MGVLGLRGFGVWGLGFRALGLGSGLGCCTSLGLCSFSAFSSPFFKISGAAFGSGRGFCFGGSFGSLGRSLPFTAAFFSGPSVSEIETALACVALPLLRLFIKASNISRCGFLFAGVAGAPKQSFTQYLIARYCCFRLANGPLPTFYSPQVYLNLSLRTEPETCSTIF